MRWIKQTFAVLGLSLRTIPQRLNSSLVSVIGIAGVVIVLVAVLSIAEGFRASMSGAGSPDRVMVLRTGANNEMTSGLSGPDVDAVKSGPGIKREGGQLLASAELYVIIDLNKRTTGTPANVPLRGIEPAALPVRGMVKIEKGRMLTFGTNEVIVGVGATRQFAGVDLGSDFKSGNLALKVVGEFSAAGSAAETEVWADAKLIQGAFRRGNSFQSVLVRLDSPGAFDSFKDFFAGRKDVSVQVRREDEYYESQSTVMTALIQGVGYTITMLMGLGAIFGAVLTMYSAVANRTREIATLRALGFNVSSVLLSVLGESLAIAAIGGAAGGGLAYLAFNGYQTSTMNFQTFSQVAFAFAVTPALLVQGTIFALIMGFVGGIPPAIRAARLPIAKALREQ